MATRRKPTFEDRVAEYVDSPQMTQRMRYGKQISARIAGNYGEYRTTASRTKKVTGECTCPSELWPCKHVHALRATWDANPDSFFDLDDWLLELTRKSKAELIEAIEQMVIASPDCLSLFGVTEFEQEEEDEDAYYG